MLVIGSAPVLARVLVRVLVSFPVCVLVFVLAIAWLIELPALAFECFGQQLDSLSLERQFGPTEQQIGGTCYAHAPAAILTAALGRHSGTPGKNVCQISAAACAFQFCKVDSSDFNEQQSKLIGSVLDVKAFNPLDGSSVGAFQRLMLLKTTAAVRDSPQIREELEKLQNSANVSVVKIADFKVRIEALNRAEREQKKTKKDFPVAEKLDHEAKKAQLSDEILEAIKSSCKTIECGKILAQQKADILAPKDSRVVSVLANGNSNTCKTDSDFRTRLGKKLENFLCLGIPIAVDLKLGFDVEVRESGPEPAWKKVVVEDSFSLHSVVLQGFERREGKEFYVFRNSWGTGSELRIPASKLCDFAEAAVLLTAKDFELLVDTKLQAPHFREKSKVGDAQSISVRATQFLKESSEPKKKAHK